MRLLSGYKRLARFLIGQRLDPASLPPPVDIALRQDGSQPRGEAAAAVKIPKERLTFAATFLEPEELPVQ
jgi:hypothetical protein